MRFSKRYLLALMLLLAVLAAAGCDSDKATPTPTPTAVAPVLDEVVLFEEQVGLGDPTVVYTLTIDFETGTYTLETEDSEPVEGEVPAGQIDRITALLEQVGFYEFDEDYIPEDGSCCDFVYYTIQVTRDGETYSVRGSDTENPEGFLSVHEALREIPSS
jgi:hypothetical protein